MAAKHPKALFKKSSIDGQISVWLHDFIFMDYYFLDSVLSRNQFTTDSFWHRIPLLTAHLYNYSFWRYLPDVRTDRCLQVVPVKPHMRGLMWLYQCTSSWMSLNRCSFLSTSPYTRSSLPFVCGWAILARMCRMSLVIRNCSTSVNPLSFTSDSVA